MRSKNDDINLLLFCLLLFSFVIGMIYARRLQSMPITSSNNRQSFISIEEGMRIINPLVISVSIEKIIDLMKQFPPETSFNITQRIIEESTLPYSDKQQLIFGLAQAFSDQASTQANFFQLLLKLNEVSEIPSVFINAVKSGYGTVIPVLLKWAKTQQRDHPELKDIENKVLYRAIDDNDVKAVEGLHQHGILISKKKATDLLWHTVSRNKSAGFIPFLANLGADLYIKKEKHTLVTKATEQNNLSTVKTLVETLEKKGVTEEEIASYLNRFVDRIIGSPIQIALQKKYTDLEIYLRKYGAHEK